MHTSRAFSNEETAEPDLTRIELLKWPRNELAAKVESLRAQRDDLLAACEAFLRVDGIACKYIEAHDKWICVFCENVSAYPNWIKHADSCEIMQTLAAIAKVSRQ